LFRTSWLRFTSIPPNRGNTLLDSDPVHGGRPPGPSSTLTAVRARRTPGESPGGPSFTASASSSPWDTGSIRRLSLAALGLSRGRHGGAPHTTVSRRDRRRSTDG